MKNGLNRIRTRAFKTKTKHLPAGDLTDYPTPLLNKYVGKKRKVDI